MNNKIICPNCKIEMHMMNNWGTSYTGDIKNVYFETFTLFAYRIKNAFTKGTGFKKVTPKMFVCSNCGKFEMYFDKNGLQTILSVDSDSDYTEHANRTFVSNTEKKVETINLTRMSRLKQRTLDRKRTVQSQ